MTGSCESIEVVTYLEVGSTKLTLDMQNKLLMTYIIYSILYR